MLAALLLVATVGAKPARCDSVESGRGRPVVLLHGLTRTPQSMATIARALSSAGFRVCNVAYPSRQHAIEVLASTYVAPAVQRCFPEEDDAIDFVTHSMGGIIVRQLAATNAVRSIGRVVMLGPPNAGSEIVDQLGHLWLFRVVNGPAGEQLGTSAASLPRRLGPATFEVGILAGDRPRNWFFAHYLPGANDGKVTVASAELQGMKDFRVIAANHMLMPRDREAIRQTIAFLEDGVFLPELAVVAESPRERETIAVSAATGGLRGLFASAAAALRPATVR